MLTRAIALHSHDRTIQQSTVMNKGVSTMEEGLCLLTPRFGPSRNPFAECPASPPEGFGCPRGGIGRWSAVRIARLRFPVSKQAVAWWRSARGQQNRQNRNMEHESFYNIEGEGEVGGVNPRWQAGEFRPISIAVALKLPQINEKNKKLVIHNPG